jgi:hypothetical protein
MLFVLFLSTSLILGGAFYYGEVNNAHMHEQVESVGRRAGAQQAPITKDVSSKVQDVRKAQHRTH